MFHPHNVCYETEDESDSAKQEKTAFSKAWGVFNKLTDTISNVAPLRTKVSFNASKDENHHTSVSPFV